jgi:hypothetical protein
MTFKEECIFIILSISIIVFTLWLIGRAAKNIKDCEDKGGSLVQGQCLKVEVLK